MTFGAVLHVELLWDFSFDFLHVSNRLRKCLCLFFIKIERSKMDRNAPMTIPEHGLLDFLVSKRSAGVKYTTVLE